MLVAGRVSKSERHELRRVALSKVPKEHVPRRRAKLATVRTSDRKVNCELVPRKRSAPREILTGWNEIESGLVLTNPL